MGRITCLALVVAGLASLLTPVRAAAEDVDGTYHGTYSGTGNCPGGGPSNMVVRDRTMTRTFGPSVTIQGVVAADGTVTGQAGQVGLSGAIHGGHAELDINSARGCRVHQSLDRK